MCTLWKWLRALSIDVCLSACAVLYAFSYLSQQALTQLPPYLILGISVWLIYTADHLWDALRIRHRAHTFRHRVHQRFFKPLTAVGGLLLVVDVWLLWRWAPAPVIYAGLGLGLFSAIHFALELLPYCWVDVSKELRVAAIYIAGAGLWHWAACRLRCLTGDTYLLGGSLLLLAWANLLIIAMYERHSDQKDGQRSLAQWLPDRHMHRLIVTLIIWAALLAAALWQHPALMLVLWAMATTLWAVVRYPSFFSEKERYRIVSDSAFLYPFLLLLTA
ncbi:MAG: hypothetical protein KatS3mg033_1421 [Thermonema sp.]|uniref:hypothetical protein n=1 Tax=Thermonema sp. TaxID=2231181 RepID=UPI0021DC1FC3|nr:hypothetical protein [Thermonema sp.]GIV39621.1 MAG: hypothetical protein KatS3mg033_1421 [Thermonema sp.]